MPLSLGPMRQLRICSLLVTVFLIGTSFATALPENTGSAAGGTIAGKFLLKDGSPLSGGQVIFFNAAAGPPASAEKYQRVPDRIVALDSDGTFKIELQPGKYYISAIRRR